MVDFGREAMFALQVLNQIMEVVIAQLLFAATNTAEQMVMRRLTDYLIACVAIHLRDHYQAEITEKVQRAIDGGAIDGRRLRLDAIIDLAGRSVPANGTEGIHDHLALGRQAIALFTDAFVIV